MTSISAEDVACHLEALLAVPSSANAVDGSSDPMCSVSHDISTLSCGCLISEKFANELSSQHGAIENENGNTLKCPTCHQDGVRILAPCVNMRNMTTYLTKLRDELALNSQQISPHSPEILRIKPSSIPNSPFSQNSPHIGMDTHIKERERDLYTDSNVGDKEELPAMFSKIDILSKRKKSTDSSGGNKSISFLTAFHEAFSEVQNISSFDSQVPEKPSSYSNSNNNTGRFSPSDHFIDDLSLNYNANSPFSPDSPTNSSILSSTVSLNNRQRKASFHTNNSVNSSNLTKLMSSSSSSNDTLKKRYPNKELLFSRNFPFFRRNYTFNVQSNNFLLKTKIFIQTQLSPELTKLVLLSEKKWFVYTIDTEHPYEQPKLLCCGKSDGSYGDNIDQMKKMNKEQILANSNISSESSECMGLLENWEHLYCQITENLLIISGTRGFLRILDLNQGGRCIFTYQCKFPIRCLDVSPNESFIALGLTGKDKYTQVEQAVIIILKLVRDQASLQILTYPFSLPYRDPICILKFSSDSTLLSVATVLESRFLIISLIDPSRPTMIMKSQRRLDTSLESEGITDISFFPDNRLMTISSSSHNSEPIIIDSNISSISGPDGIAKPKLLMKVEEVGSNIHKCCVSPRGDSVAYINRNGNVYIMIAPKIGDNDHKRIACVLDVANAFRAKDSASLRFDSDGYKLYVLDRKGVLSIADFTAGSVEDHTVTRCKIIT